MKKRFEIFVLCTLAVISGCAVVEDAKTDVQELYAPIERISDGTLVEHGVITVTGVQPRSDIVVIAPSNQHVVWSREMPSSRDVVAEVKEIERKEEDPKRSEDDRGLWVATGESWSLEDDLGRQLGVLEMCMPKGCVGNVCRSEMSPCLNPNDYRCSAGKMGETCLVRSVR